MSETAELIREIESYCRQTNTAESTFGRQAVNDGKFVARLRDGKGVTLKTLARVRKFIENSPEERSGKQKKLMATPTTGSPIATASTSKAKPFRFYDNRQKYLAFVHTCNEKWIVAQRAGKELQHLYPTPPALRIFDAGMGDATVLTQLMRDMHRRFPHVPFLVAAKEISLEDARLGLAKMPDRFYEHPATVMVLTNLHYSEAPWLMPRDLNAAATLNWHEIKLTGDSAYEYGEQIEALEPLIADGWQTQASKKTGNPIYARPSVLVLYREDHRFLLDEVIPKPGHTQGNYDLVVASQPWRARMSAKFKAARVLSPLTSCLAPGGRLLAIQSYGRDPALEIVQEMWPGEEPFKINRHALLKALKDEMGRDARDFNFNAFSDNKSILRYQMHTLPSEIGESIGTSTLFAAWNAAIYVNQIEDERVEEAVGSGAYLQATDKILKRHGGLWFNDETFVVSRHRI